MLETVEKYQYIINYQAFKAHEKLPKQIQTYIGVDDLEQEGRIAFIKACHDFDETKGIKFETVLTTYLINAFARHIVRVCTKSRLPLTDPLSLAVIELEAESNGFKHPMNGSRSYYDPQYEEIDFQLSLNKIKDQLSDNAKQMIALLETGELQEMKFYEMVQELGVCRWTLKKVSGEILNALYSKNTVNGWRVTT